MGETKKGKLIGFCSFTLPEVKMPQTVQTLDVQNPSTSHHVMIAPVQNRATQRPVALHHNKSALKKATSQLNNSTALEM